MSLPTVLPPIVILLAVSLYFVTSPHDGNFWWSDAPRHAMDGLFYADFFKAFPIENFQQYAFEYYLRYPALTILFYPPVFAVIEGIFFLLFGCTHSVAQITVAVFVFFAGLGAYHLAKRYLVWQSALAVAIMFLGSNEIAFWGRQVMLDLPAYAFLLWTVIFFLKYLDSQEIKLLYVSIILFSFGIYTKLNVAFMAPVFIGGIGYKHGKDVFNKHTIIVASIFVLLMLPWLYVTVKFGQVNIGAISGGQVNSELSRTSFENWAFYAKLLPKQIGFISCALGVCYILFAFRKKNWGINKIDAFFISSWFVLGYLIFSIIALKESRHDIFILFPIILFSVLFLDKAIKLNKISKSLPLLIAGGVFFNTIVFSEVPYVDGYKEAAFDIIKIAPKSGVILFSGYRDGSFIFNIKTQQDSNLSVIRADKILLKIAIKREMGVGQKLLSEEEIIEVINNNGVHYIVVDPEFWIDLPVMQKFQKVLSHPQFEEIKKIDIKSNVEIKDRRLIIYKNNGKIKKPSGSIMDIPSIGIKVYGQI